MYVDLRPALREYRCRHVQYLTNITCQYVIYLITSGICQIPHQHHMQNTMD